MAGTVIRGVRSPAMGEVGTSLSYALTAARRHVVDSDPPAEFPAGAVSTPCRVLGELLGLDAAWVLLGEGVPPTVHARWARPGIRPHRLGVARLATILAECPDVCTGCRDGRYAVIVAPIMAGAERLGTLVGSVRSAHEFDTAELQAAELVAAGAAASLATPVAPPPPRPSGAAMRPLAHLEMLHSLSVRMTRAHSEREVGEAVVTELTSLIDHHACRFYLISEAGDTVVPLAYEGKIAEYEDDRAADLVCRVGEGVAGRAVVDARSRRIPDASVDAFAVDVPGSEPVDESMMVAPILSDGEPIGAIVLSRLGLDQFDDTDLHVLEVVAGNAAAACENVRLYASMREAAEVSEALLELGAALALQGSVEAVAEMLARALDRLVDSAAISVWLRRGDEMALAAHVGYTPVEARRLAENPVAVTEAPFAGTLDSRELAVCEPGQAGALAAHLETVPPGTTFAVVPVGEWAANRAAIVVQRGHRRGAPGRRDEAMLLGIADQALLAMVNRSLYTELEASFLATVEALGNALGTKDEYTGDHAQALVGLTTNVARRMGLPGPELRDITVAAALHDVGKIGVPAAILAKPGPLSVEEWVVMRRHPELGARIMEPVPALDGARRLVLACHEHWDGSGYPHGLRGEEIPVGSRVILACDAFHAMTSDRVYRSAMPVADAIAELRCCAGSHFDPKVAATLVEAVLESGAAAGR
jgi:HD-GYP domain-containing protein (c-di-GMP phosphodiesterase class II)/putative methionine-R-sulfoxide reductase with GAF domain